MSIMTLDYCGGLALAGCQLPSHTLSSTVQGVKIRWKGRGSR